MLLPIVALALLLGAIAGRAVWPASSSSTAPPAPTATTPPVVRTVLPTPSLGLKIERCLPNVVDDIQATADSVRQCLGVPADDVTGVPGDVPVLLIEGFRDPALGHFVIAWQRDGAWDSWEPGDPRPFREYDLVGRARPYDIDVNANTAPREATIDGKTYLAALFVDRSYGDQTKMRALLLAYEQGRWRVRWNSAADPSGRFGHLSIAFGGEDLETLLVQGDTFTLDDEKSIVFHESNAGLHRVFRHTFAFDDGEYVLRDATVQPSPYNTLVETVYALSNGDDATASSLVTDPSLTTSLKDLVLRSPFTGGEATSTDGHTVVDVVVFGPPERHVRVAFVERNGDFYIADVEERP
jgi:hypothetical protein